MNDKPLITIRRMQKEDAPAVADIEKANFSEPWPMEEFAKAATNDNYVYIVAAKDEQVIGYAGATVVCDEADVTNIAVSSDFRRLGIGEMLMTILVEEAGKRNAEKIFLEVRESNAPAQCMYKKIGFVQVGLRKNFYQKPTENALLMMKDII